MAPRILQDKNAKGQTIWTFTLDGVDYVCESWPEVLNILQAKQDLEQEADRGYGQGRYMGD